MVLYVSKFLGEDFREFMYNLLEATIIEGKFYSDSSIEEEFLDNNKGTKYQYAVLVARFESYHHDNDVYSNGEKEWAFLLYKLGSDSPVYVAGFYKDFKIEEDVDEEFTYEEDQEISNLKSHFRLPIIMVKKDFPYVDTSIGFSDPYILSTDTNHEFYVEKNTYRVGRAGPVGRRRNLHSKAEVNAIRYLSEFVDYDGLGYLKSFEKNGMSYFMDNQETLILDGEEPSKKSLLFDPDYYVDIRNRLRPVSDLDDISNIVDLESLDDFDYSDKYLAYVLNEDNSLQIYDRSTQETIVMGKDVSFFHVSDKQVIYQIKRDSDYGVYVYSNGKSYKLLDYLVVDCIYYEGMYYFIDIDSRLYKVNGLSSDETVINEPKLVFNQDIEEYIFSDQFIYVTTTIGYVHVLHSIKDGQANYERALSLGTLAHLSFYFSDGEKFYYNGDYEIPFTFSIDLNYEGPIGDLIYEDDSIRVEEMSHIGWEFMESSLIVTDKIQNKVDIVEDIYHLKNEYVIGDYLYCVASTGWGSDQNVIKYDLEAMTYELIFEDVSEQWFSVFEFNPYKMTLIYGDKSLVQLDLGTGQEKELGIEDLSGIYTVYVDDDILILHSNKELYKYDYENVLIIDSYKLDYHYEYAQVYNGKFKYKNKNNQIQILDIYSNELVTIDEGAGEIFYKADNCFYYFNNDNNLVYVHESQPIVISKLEQKVERNSNMFERINDSIYFVDHISNSVQVYNLHSDRASVVHVSFEYDQLSRLNIRVLDDMTYLEVGYLINNQYMSEYLKLEDIN